MKVDQMLWRLLIKSSLIRLRGNVHKNNLLDVLFVKPKLDYVVSALFFNLFENSKICIFSPQFLYFPRFWNNKGQLEGEVCNEV